MSIIDKAPASIKELVEKMNPHYTQSGAAGTFDQKAMIAAVMPEGKSLEELVSYQQLEENIVAAATFIHGAHTIDAMEKDKTLNRSTASFKLGNNLVETNLDRKYDREVAGKPVVKHGNATAKVSSRDTSNNGVFKQVRTTLAELGGNKLASQALSA